MTYRMFLDDERMPPTDGKDWVIVRSSQEAIDYVKLNGMPEYISFDHDLGGNDTAMVFVNWLVDLCLDNGYNITEKYYVHSQNPVGAANIRSHMDSFIAYQKL